MSAFRGGLLGGGGGGVLSEEHRPTAVTESVTMRVKSPTLIAVKAINRNLGRDSATCCNNSS